MPVLEASLLLSASQLCWERLTLCCTGCWHMRMSPPVALQTVYCCGRFLHSMQDGLMTYNNMLSCSSCRRLTAVRGNTDEVLRGLLAYEDISFCRRADGSLWLLGSGTHGKVSANSPSQTSCSHAHTPVSGSWLTCA